MRRFKTPILALACLLLLCVGARPDDIVLSWSGNKPSEQVTFYKVYCATNVAGQYQLFGTTSTNSITKTVQPSQCFYYVTACNFWGEGKPSVTNNTPDPVTSVTNTAIAKSALPPTPAQ